MPSFETGRKEACQSADIDKCARDGRNSKEFLLDRVHFLEKGKQNNLVNIRRQN